MDSTGFEKDACTIVLFDSAGRIVFMKSVRELDPETLGELVDKIAALARV